MKQKKNKKNRHSIINTDELSKYGSLIRPVIEKIVKNVGFHLFDVSFINENQENYLRLTIMHDERPISISDCEIISRSVGKELDSSDPIPFPYMLEVQSRGEIAAPLQGINVNDIYNHKYEFALEKIDLTVRS